MNCLVIDVGAINFVGLRRTIDQQLHIECVSKIASVVHDKVVIIREQLCQQNDQISCTLIDFMAGHYKHVIADYSDRELTVRS